MQGQRPPEGSVHGQPSKLWQPSLGHGDANQGIQIGRHKVRSLVRKAARKSVWKRKFIHTTDSKHNLPVAANVLNRQFNPVAPNTAYVSDITYIRTGSGWLYLAIVLDL